MTVFSIDPNLSFEQCIGLSGDPHEAKNLDLVYLTDS